MVFNTHPEIKDYDDLVGKVNAVFSGATEDALDDPQTIVDEIHALATGESQKFRTLVGQMGNDLMALRNAVPIEEYLGKDCFELRISGVRLLESLSTNILRVLGRILSSSVPVRDFNFH